MSTTEDIMDKWIDKRSFEEIVAATPDSGLYGDTLSLILRDEAHGWRFSYFKPDGHSSHDAQLCRMRQEKKTCDDAVKANTQIVATTEANIKAARLPPTDPDYKKASRAEITNWDRQHVQAQEDIMHDSKRSAELDELIHKWSWNRYLELGRESALWRLSCKYKIDRDLDFLKRGVSYACGKADKERYNLFGDGPAPQEAREPRGEDLSAW